MLPVAVLLLLLGAYLGLSSVQSFVDGAYAALVSGRPARVEAWVHRWGAWGAAALLALMLLQSVVAVLPSILPLIAAVLLYGPWWGGLLAWMGMLLAAALAYTLGALLQPVTVDALVGAAARERMEGLVRRYGVWAIVTARVAPALSTDAVSYGAGLLGMSFPRFLAATGGGTLPLVVLVAYLGASAERLVNGLVWVSVGSIAAFGLYVAYDQWATGDAA